MISFQHTRNKFDGSSRVHGSQNKEYIKILNEYFNVIFSGIFFIYLDFFCAFVIYFEILEY